MKGITRRRCRLRRPPRHSSGDRSIIEATTHRGKGLVLITESTSQGKTATMASMVDAIDRHSRTHIVTIENPIGYVRTMTAEVLAGTRAVRNSSSQGRSRSCGIRLGDVAARPIAWPSRWWSACSSVPGSSCAARSTGRNHGFVSMCLSRAMAGTRQRGEGTAPSPGAVSRSERGFNSGPTISGVYLQPRHAAISLSRTTAGLVRSFASADTLDSCRDRS